ncbi:hypothetical protein [Candidatus Leptofilum sp.]|uniref:hypothetical protein n=1 Tax=Candidatus Leptofilum sp. TaxID=3241576 RepID=UPI003B5B1CAE
MSKLREQLADYINYAMAIAFTVAAFLLSKDMLLDLLQQNVIRGALTITLLLVTLAMSFLYLQAVRTELDLLDNVLKSEKMQITEVSGKVYLAIIALSIFIGLLIANVTNIIYYAGIAAIYSIFDMYGQAIVIRNFNIQLHQKNYRTNIPLVEQEADVLFDYYVGKPLLVRIAATLSLECAAFALAIYSNNLNIDWGTNVAYAIIITTLITGEILIYSWRKSRDTALQEIREQRKELLISEAKTPE